MPSLKEIKSRIASVRSTLKITSAMKMVSSAKLHHAQQAIGNMVPYEAKLHGILADLLGDEAVVKSIDAGILAPSGFDTKSMVAKSTGARVALVAFSSCSSLCGAFNSNAIKNLNATVASLQEAGFSKEDIDIYPVGRKIADAARKSGCVVKGDWSALAEKPDYKGAAELAELVSASFKSGEVKQVALLYNHYASNASQPSLRETYLPLSLATVSGDESTQEDDYIIEPSAVEMVNVLLPKVLLLKMYTVLLDANAAEHAARVVAMQIASDNADKLLDELSLEYNKRRQQAITNELLDIVGGNFA